MSIAARHLQTRRPRKDRAVTWSRHFDDGCIEWVFWRRDRRNTLHYLSRRFTLAEIDHSGGAWVKDTLRFFKRKLRDLVDEIDLAAMQELERQS